MEWILKPISPLVGSLLKMYLNISVGQNLKERRRLLAIKVNWGNKT